MSLENDPNGAKGFQGRGDAGTRRCGDQIGRELELLTKALRPIPGDPIQDLDSKAIVTPL